MRGERSISAGRSAIPRSRASSSGVVLPVRESGEKTSSPCVTESVFEIQEAVDGCVIGSGLGVVAG